MSAFDRILGQVLGGTDTFIPRDDLRGLIADRISGELTAHESDTAAQLLEQDMNTILNAVWYKRQKELMAQAIKQKEELVMELKRKGKLIKEDARNLRSRLNILEGGNYVPKPVGAKRGRKPKGESPPPPPPVPMHQGEKQLPRGMRPPPVQETIEGLP
jgi:hypothetical protein